MWWKVWNISTNESFYKKLKKYRCIYLYCQPIELTKKMAQLRKQKNYIKKVWTSIIWDHFFIKLLCLNEQKKMVLAHRSLIWPSIILLKIFLFFSENWENWLNLHKNYREDLICESKAIFAMGLVLLIIKWVTMGGKLWLPLILALPIQN